MYASDILLLSDTTGLATHEGILCRLPMYMPYDSKFINTKLALDHNDRNPINPIMREMVNKNFISNKLDDDGKCHTNSNIEEFIKYWYNTNVDLFWKEILS